MAKWMDTGSFWAMLLMLVQLPFVIIWFKIKELLNEM